MSNDELLQRIETFKDLKTNWDGDGGEAISAAVVAVVKRFCGQLADTPKFYVYPCSHGGLQLESDCSTHFIEVEFRPDNVISVFAGNNGLEPTECIQEEFPLGSKEALEFAQKWQAKHSEDKR